MKINITSEIGNLKTVLVHRPGTELERLTPDLLESLLFDDIPWLKKMREEHDRFTKIMRNEGINVIYVEDLLADSLKNKTIKKRIIKDIIEESGIFSEETRMKIEEKMLKMKEEKLANVIISGLTKDEIKISKKDYNLWDTLNEGFPFYITPSPNLYFMRDPIAFLGNGISYNSMHTVTRRREARMLSHVISQHKSFSSLKKVWYTPDDVASVEGGDILVLSKNVIAIGCSERTTPQGIEAFAKNVLSNGSAFKKILVFDIPNDRAFMHLDTVFTMIDYDKFSIFPGIEKSLNIYEIKMKNKTLSYTYKKSLIGTLKESLKLPAVKLIRSGGGDMQVAEREQWNDSTNTFAIAPGKVLAYSRNEISNETLRKNGIEVIEFEGSELVRGRGGSRCMTCPIEREDI